MNHNLEANTTDRILLVRPHYIPNPKHRSRPMLSLSLLCLGAALEQAGYEVILIDAPTDSDYLEKVATLARSVIWVGITAMTTQIPDGLVIAEVVRRCSPETPIVWGGIHPTLFPEQTCRDSRCDIVVRGEGEETAVDLTAALRGEKQLREVKGLVFKENAKPFATAPRPVMAGAQLHRPAYHLLSRQQINLLSVGTELAIGNATFVHAGRGCPYRCSFCINTIDCDAGRRHRTRSAEAILDDVEYLQGTYKIQSFLIQDEDFFADRQRLEDFLAGIVERRLSFFWQTSARANDFGDHYINEDLLKLMISRGLIVLGVGAESGSDHTLKVLRKDITVEQIRNAVRISAGQNYRLVLSYMIGIPGESRYDMLKTVKEIDYLSKISDNVYLGGPYPFRPYPGSELFQQLVTARPKLPDNLAAWSDEAKSLEGFMDVSHLPWVTDAKLVMFLAMVIPFIYLGSREAAQSRLGRGRKTIAKLMLHLFRSRINNNFWHLRVEQHLLGVLNRLRGML